VFLSQFAKKIALKVCNSITECNSLSEFEGSLRSQRQLNQEIGADGAPAQPKISFAGTYKHGFG